jgi:hypothetical protein
MRRLGTTNLTRFRGSFMNKGTWLLRLAALVLLVAASASCTDDPTGPTVHTAGRTAVEEFGDELVTGDGEEWTSPATFRDHQRMRETARRIVGPPLRGDDPLEDVGPADNAANRIR